MWKLSTLTIVAVACASDVQPPSRTCDTKDVALLQASVAATRSNRLVAAESEPELPQPSDWPVKTRICSSTGKVSPFTGKALTVRDCENLTPIWYPFAEGCCECTDKTDELIAKQTEACAGKTNRAPCTLDFTETVNKGKASSKTGVEINSVCDDGKCVPFHDLRCAGKQDGDFCTKRRVVDSVTSGCPSHTETGCSSTKDYEVWSLGTCSNEECQEGYKAAAAAAAATQ